MKQGVRLSGLGALGVAVSSYAVHVKQQKIALQEGYKALCDSEVFSCSLVLTSEYSSLLSHLGLVEKNSTFDVSNAHLGVFVYSLFLMYPVVRKVPCHAEFYVAVSCCATGVMLYLAFILVFVLRDFCMVCVATYGITAALLRNSLTLLRSQRRGRLSSKAEKAR